MGLALPITPYLAEKIKLMQVGNKKQPRVLLRGCGFYCWAGDSGTQRHISDAQEAQPGTVDRYVRLRSSTPRVYE